MAIHARLSAPKEEQTSWPWHEAKWRSLPSNVLQLGDRRLEADNFLSGGYGDRLAMEARTSHVWRLSDVARVWQPSRLKGIQLTKQYGTPFLAATQVFDLRPTPRKFLSLDRTEGSSGRFVGQGEILVTCSGSVGKSTLAYGPHCEVLISHDLLRVASYDKNWSGWAYAFLKSEQARSMMSAAQYGHMIKHLEPAHLNALPIPMLNDDLLEKFQKSTDRILELRNSSWSKQLEAERLLSEAVGWTGPTETAESFFNVSTPELFGGRRRFDAAYYVPEVRSILSHFTSRGLRTDPLSQVTKAVWWMSRFKRVFGEKGVPYLSADELFTLNPGVTKRVLVEQTENAAEFFVKKGWIVMARSGQVYGLNGSVALITERHEASFCSDDFVRIIPDQDRVRPGYLFTVLGHPLLGRPLVIRNAYGTSIPHLDPTDIASTPVVRLAKKLEDTIADTMEQSVRDRDLADELEDSIAQQATELNSRFIAGDVDPFVLAKQV